MKKLRDQGLCRKQLNIVFDAVILSSITYAVCAWSTSYLKNSKVALMHLYDVCINYGLCQFVFNFQETANDYDLGLYQVMLSDNSCIHQLLPAKKH
jgi:hypothetical protein